MILGVNFFLSHLFADDKKEDEEANRSGSTIKVVHFGVV